MNITDGYRTGKVAAMVSAMISGLGSWESAWLAQQPKFYRVYLLGYGGTDVTCDVQQEVQDWLMREFDPATMWEYTTVPHRSDRPTIQTGFDRVTVREEVFSVLSLRWS